MTDNETHPQEARPSEPEPQSVVGFDVLADGYITKAADIAKKEGQK